MPYVWSFYTLSDSLDVVKSHAGLEEALRSTLRLEIRDNNDVPWKAQLIQELEESSNIFILLDDDELRIPAILAYSGESTAIDTFTEWLKSSLGLIVTSIVLDASTMLQVADALTGKSQTYDTRLFFDIVTEAKNLTKMEMEIDKASLRSLSNSSGCSYSEGLVSFLYNETGMRLERLPLASISMAGNAKIWRNKITTIEADVQDGVLQVILKSAQYQF
ncbi:hypothetical protein HG536_0B02200 [Torulaspora globosa]|uniref:Uncharacterized protein n=1 Tax=Torulaspora globosa TaxID=48254 RepID=A0A7G3ZCX1_9SACH|nr:uncharacterized protein HG536_0B02200 [Torulaspora globosa]QLL31357.1 hypothetical protein HG536_0B02200 [Torulaspora globosa]